MSTRARPAAQSRGGVDDVGRSVVAILLTDVEPAVRLNAALEAEGIETVTISPMDDVRGEMRRARPTVVVLTGALLDGANIALVRQLLWDNVPVLGFTDVSDPTLRDRLREIGYAETWSKPVRIDEVVDAVRRRLERQRLAELTGLVGESAGIREVLVKVEQIAPVSSTLLIEGESGTGKELVARAIHRLSPRRGKPFIAVNVGALPETLLESELFGHEKGSFTGAAERRLGRFELADTGTLFLDEIGEIPQSTQVKLLRVLEEREVTRVGGSQSIPIDVRVVAATNRPLREHVEEGGFRADLFYRLNVLSVYLPPLRERRDDIPLLVRRFVSEFSALHDREFQGISADALALLVEYAWPGNVRELRNLVESMVVLAHGREIVADDIPRSIREGGGRRLLPVHVGPVLQGAERAQGRELEFIVRSLVELKLQVEELRRRMDVETRVVQMAPGSPVMPAGWVGEVRPSAPLNGGLPYDGLSAGGAGYPGMGRGIEPREQGAPPPVITLDASMTMADIERVAILAALRDSAGNRRKAAERLGIGERTLYRKLREYEGAEEGEADSALDET
ncbi:MAG TPA: sigma-54-dependent Fis family transcriptional regulator [Gemmatimonas aurantiaca]|uniref:Sigma-54-dependent Fis family transcriptional regulator n=1 Tax=Gemmatimonas aurantiaca TaxID=173480 RepID=A0A3D4VBF2_9BACT|nr:sigma-54 dependent transcriptional regulator [Gemmatimonas aurantiaca]HCT58451.1 sigma-54-dependent Fis family transcriptional regulator [Gemmatimonas aurantiaca]